MAYRMPTVPPDAPAVNASDALAAAEPPAVEVVVRRGVAVPMRDGVVLRADVWGPADGRPRPALLQRTPYDRTDSGAAIAAMRLEPLRAAQAGFVTVIQDVRGRYGSDGTFDPFAQELDDGEDTIAWLAAQPFCDGRVMTYGASYVGATQLLAAVRAPSALVAAAPAITSAEYWEGWAYQGGALSAGFLAQWTFRSLAPDAAVRLANRDPDTARRMAAALERLADDPDAALRTSPGELARLLEPVAPYLHDWLAHPTRDAFWQATAIRDRYAQIAVPALHLAGWHDAFLGGTLANFAGLRAHAATELARAGQRLVVGPWTHGAQGAVQGERCFGAHAAAAWLDPTRMQLEFFAAVLRGEAPPGPPVRLFVMGANRWRDEDTWPLRRARAIAWHLHPDGALDPAPPPARAEASPLAHDPADPVPTVAGATLLPGGEATLRAGARDRRGVQARADVLLFESAPLADPLELTGPLAAEVWLVPDPAGADVVVALSEVLSDGRALHVADGVSRLPAGGDGSTPVRVEVDLLATSLALAAGQRLRVEVCGSCAPRFDVHPRRPARHLLLHDAAHPSRVLLPVV